MIMACHYLFSVLEHGGNGSFRAKLVVRLAPVGASCRASPAKWLDTGHKWT